MDDAWHSHYLVTPRISNPGERAAIYRGAARGEFVRVVRGVYVARDMWDSLDFEGRHLARVRGVALLRPGTVFSHLSAALVWKLPVVGGDLAIPRCVVPHAPGGRSMTGLRRHAVGIPDDVRRIDGLLVTAPSDTAVHIAAGYRPEVAVPVLDAVLGRPDLAVEREDLRARAAILPASSGSARAAWSIEFADAASGSPGESLSRVGIHRLGLPAPQLQVRFLDAFVLIGVVDFWWPDAQVIGEFDGIGKYLRDFSDLGRNPADIVVAEKRREDRLRALGPRVVRWDWPIARDLTALRRRLSEAGLRAA